MSASLVASRTGLGGRQGLHTHGTVEDGGGRTRLGIVLDDLQVVGEGLRLPQSSEEDGVVLVRGYVLGKVLGDDGKLIDGSQNSVKDCLRLATNNEGSALANHKARHSLPLGLGHEACPLWDVGRQEGIGFDENDEVARGEFDLGRDWDLESIGGDHPLVGVAHNGEDHRHLAD